jgi:uncharacterized membrane protein
MKPGYSESSRVLAIGFVATLLVFVVSDAAWLTLYAIDMFQREIGPLLRAQPHFGAAAAFYVIYAVALTLLAVRPALELRSAQAATWRGALLGLAAYATYDLTNYATLEAWSLTLALKDLGWGTFASGLASIAGYLAAGRRMGGREA